jgi:hypothetical protein
MHRVVEDPVAQDQRAEHRRAAAVAAQGVVHAGDEKPPPDGGREAVRDRIGDEVERVRGHEPRNDAHLLQAGQEEDGPELVEPLCGEGEGTE